MKNVLHLIDTGGPGGAETVYLNLIDGLDCLRWRSFPVVPTRNWVHAQLVERGIEPILLGSTIPFDLPYLVRLRGLIRRHDIHVIHGHLLGSNVSASLLGMLLGVPVICTVHGQIDIAPDERFRDLKLAILNRGAAKIVFVSEALRSHFLESTSLRPELTAVIPNGIDAAAALPRRDPTVRAELGIGREEFLVGAVGNVRPAKGYDVLLRAAALLKQRSPGYRFVIIGQAEGALYRSLTALRDELGLQAEVSFTGFRSDVHRVMSGLDVYAITSRSEGFSLSTLQAMASALPVVATRCGGPETILEHDRTGLLVESESPEQVAMAIERLRGSAEQRRGLGKAARRVARAEFTLEAQVRNYERLYQEALILGPRRRPGALLDPRGGRSGGELPSGTALEAPAGSEWG
jgi:glycosyltransferase involved in cell wall biosynthesis